MGLQLSGVPCFGLQRKVIDKISDEDIFSEQICYFCNRKLKRKQALLGSNLPAIGFRATLSVHAGLTTVGFAFLAQIALHG